MTKTPCSPTVTLPSLLIASLPHGLRWKKACKILVREMLSNTNISNSFSHRKVEVMKSIKDVYEKKIGCKISVGELAFLTATNAIRSMIWGETLQGEGDAIGAKFREFVSELMVLLGKPNISDLYPVLACLDLQGIERRTRNVSHGIDRLFDSAIEKRMNVTGKGESKSKKKDVLQYLLELTKSDSDSASMTMNEIKAILIVCFLVQPISLTSLKFIT